MTAHMPLAELEPAAVLRSNYAEMLHNANIFSKLYGAPSIAEGLLYYRDADDVLVVGYPVYPSGTRPEHRIRRLLAEFAGEARPPRSVSYWGPAFLYAGVAGGPYACSEYRVHEPCNVDVFLDLRAPGSKRVASRRWVRRALSAGLSCEPAWGQAPSPGHEALYRLFLERHPRLTVDDRLYLEQWRNVMREDSTLTVDVYRGCELTGFALLNVFCEGTPTYAYGFFDNSAAGTSDLAYYGMITTGQAIGARYLDLGYSISPTLLRYKEKWGAVSTCPPPVEATFSLVDSMGKPLILPSRGF